MSYEDNVRKELEAQQSDSINAAFGPQPAAAGPGPLRAPPAAGPRMRGKKVKGPSQKGMSKSGKRR